MIYSANSLIVTAEAVMLAFQHYVVMLGTIVMLASFLVPQMGGDHVSSRYRHSSLLL